MIGATARGLAGAILGVTLSMTVAAYAATRPRVASINMCTDQLVLALADDDQIAGVSSLATRRGLSYHHARATHFHQLSGSAESAIALQPDIIVASDFARPITRALLAQSGLRIVTFGEARTPDDVIQQIRRMGQLLGQEARAETAIEQIAASWRQLERPPSGRTVLPLARRGWVAGSDALLGDLIARAGLAHVGGPETTGARVPLERLALLTPDYVLLEASATANVQDNGTALLRHPALQHLAARPVIHMPAELTVCAGPMLAEAMDRLRAAITGEPRR